LESDDLNRSVWRRRLVGRFAPAYWLVLLGALVAAWSAPRTGWDLLAYVAAAEDPWGSEPAQLQEDAYRELALLAGEERAAVLRGEPEDAGESRGATYRRTMAGDPEAFAAQLGFYRGRLLYLGLIRALHAAGLSLGHAVLLLSVLGGALYGAVLFLWLARHLPGPYAPLVGAVALLVTDASKTMAMTTPDMLAGALLVTGAWLLVELRRFLPALLVLLAALLVRDDHALLVGALLLAGLVPASGLPQLPRSRIVLGLVLSAMVVLACRGLGEVHPPWATWRHTFVEYMAYPLAESGSADPGFALSYTLRCLPKLAGGRVAITLILAAAAVASGRSGGRLEPGAGLAAVAGLAWLAHFALFPAEWSRLLLPYSTLVVVGLAAVWRARGMPWTDEPAQPMSAQAAP